MTKINRTTENNAEWFYDFLKSFADLKVESDSISNIIKNRTIESVIKTYREQVGLDIIGNEETEETIKNAAEIKYKFISKRAKEQNAIDLIKSDEKLKKIIDSFCSESGGNKSPYAIMNFLREKLGNDLIKLSDKQLLDYIEERKKQFKENVQHIDDIDAGKIGTETKEHGDFVAEYINKK